LREAGAHAQAAGGRAVQFEPAVEFGEAFAHAGEAVAAGGGLRAQAAAVVADLDLDLRLSVATAALAAQADAHLDRARVGVAGDVGQALLQHAQQGEADAVVERLVAASPRGSISQRSSMPS
jgi:hypothetical protein